MEHGPKKSVDEFATGPFRPHGRIEIWAEGNVVRLDAAGPFNKEAIVAMGATWRALFDGMPADGPFADLVTVHRSVMASQEVVDAFGGFLAANTAARQAPSAVAWVVDPEVEGASLMLPKFAAVYVAAGRNFRFFDNEPEAEAWVREQLRGLPQRPPGGGH
ncbi:MAG: hypothetical protein JNK22_17950 [Rhodocyclaceae bacterium]|nr:hypothetical protein [Rhodocyclaceae bacterium]